MDLHELGVLLLVKDSLLLLSFVFFEALFGLVACQLAVGDPLWKIGLCLSRVLLNDRLDIVWFRNLSVDFVLVLPPKQSVVLLHYLIGVVFLSVICGKLVHVRHERTVLSILDWADICFTLGVNFVNFLLTLVCRNRFSAIVSCILILNLGTESIGLCYNVRHNISQYGYFLIALHCIQDIWLLADGATVCECIISNCNTIWIIADRVATLLLDIEILHAGQMHLHCTLATCDQNLILLTLRTVVGDRGSRLGAVLRWNRRSFFTRLKI